MLPGCLENWSLGVTKYIAHIVGGYQNEQPLADKFLEFGKHSYTEYEYYFKKTTVYISI